MITLFGIYGWFVDFVDCVTLVQLGFKFSSGDVALFVSITITYEWADMLNSYIPN